MLFTPICTHCLYFCPVILPDSKLLELKIKHTVLFSLSRLLYSLSFTLCRADSYTRSWSVVVEDGENSSMIWKPSSCDCITRSFVVGMILLIDKQKTAHSVFLYHGYGSHKSHNYGAAAWLSKIGEKKLFGTISSQDLYIKKSNETLLLIIHTSQKAKGHLEHR